ncbi:MAG: esterase/lipase family protein [Egibacteraceae bacterium]
MRAQAGERLDDRAIVARQLRDAARSVARPSAWMGAARELALSAFHIATYPLGIATADLAYEPATPRRVEPHPALLADPDAADVPVVLVHGYFHNRSAFLIMTRALHRAGFRHVHGLNYNPLRHDCAELAAMLAIEVERVLDATGQQRCVLVGHSMGGIVARLFVQELAAPGTVDTVVTLGSPHRGSYTAHLGFGPAAAELRPRSRLLRRLEEGARPSGTRWIAYYSDLDLMVTPAVNAKLVHPAVEATNIALRDTGHLSLLLSGEALRSVVDHLADRTMGWSGEHPRPLSPAAAGTGSGAGGGTARRHGPDPG